MKLYATIKNSRGGKKSTSDDTRIVIELSYKNQILGSLGLYAINGIGYRIVWKDDKGGQMIKGLDEGRTK